DLVREAGLEKTCDSLTAICLSDAVASEVADLEWREIAVARQPTTTALLSVIVDLDEGGRPTPAQTLSTDEPDVSLDLHP
ncbi:unnamed protein product, partial [Discosporangium mesarthrocarpum]